MGIIEDIKRMQAEGRSEQEIASQLQGRGYAQQEVYEALAQAKIKNAVSGTGENTAGSEEHAMPSAGGAMQPSMLQSGATDEPPSPELNAQAEYAPAPYPSQAPYAQPYTAAPPGQQGYGYQEQPYYPGPSTDAITEMVEQIIVERTNVLHQEITKGQETRQLIETKIEYIDDRLKKIERIIDRLQLSVLQKVGEYVGNVEDLKTELVETQKSFKSLLTSRPTKTSPEETQ